MSGFPGYWDVRHRSESGRRSTEDLHRETRELADYNLVVAKNGPTLKPAKEGTRFHINGRTLSWPMGRTAVISEFDGHHPLSFGGSVTDLVKMLSNFLHAPVIDRTGIAGAFDFEVVFQPVQQDLG